MPLADNPIGRFGANHSKNLGKQGNKPGITLSIWLSDAAKIGVSQDGIRGMFKDVGRWLDINRRVEVRFSHLSVAGSQG